jgi:hypothetical protein
MKLFRGNLFSIVLWLTLISFAGYRAYLYYEQQPCKNPIEYKIGELDPRFGVSKEQFLIDIDTAGNLWSDAMGKALFTYNPNGNLTINLVYDDRQKITQQENILNSAIEQNKQVADSVKQEFAALKEQYSAAKVAYNSDLSAFNKAQTDYNNEVTYWNEKGGAPSREYAALQAQKNALASQRATLEVERQKVNGLAAQINTLIDKYNLLVNHINDTVDAINNDGLAGTQFEEGVYISDREGTRITIYQFNNKTYFIRVLSHELGHSLGLPHNGGKDSIMSPVNQSKSLKLSTEDLASITELCKE